ncbi:MAG TPA: hypothetical protein VIW03_19170, partial [Anaeromyxobacter sp.]
MQREARRVRVVALHVPDLPLQRVRRAREAARRCPGDPADRQAEALRQAQDGSGAETRPVAIVAEGRVVCADAAARAAGVLAGASIAEARAACGRLLAVAQDPSAERAALRALAEVMLGIAPAVELALPDVLLLDASAAHLHAPRRAGDRAGPPSPKACVDAVAGALPGEEELARRA